MGHGYGCATRQGAMALSSVGAYGTIGGVGAEAGLLVGLTRLVPHVATRSTPFVANLSHLVAPKVLWPKIRRPPKPRRSTSQVLTTSKSSSHTAPRKSGLWRC